MFLKLQRCVLTLGRIKRVQKQFTLKGRVKLYKYLCVLFDRKENTNFMLKKN